MNRTEWQLPGCNVDVGPVRFEKTMNIDIVLPAG